MPRRKSVDKAKVRELYQTEQYSQETLAQMFHCSRNTIRRMVGSTTNDAWRGGVNPTVTIIYDPNEIFDPGADISVASFVFGAYLDIKARKNDTIVWNDDEPVTRTNGADTICWPDWMEFLIGRPSQQVCAVCVDGIVVREDGVYLKPNSSGGATWLPL